MKLNQHTTLTISLLAAAGILFVGCTKQAREDTTNIFGEIEKMPIVKQLSELDVPKPHSNAIHFVVNSASLDKADKAVLDSYLTWLGTHPKVSVTVEGNCDARGSKALNQALGQQRADRVRSYLVAGGLSSKRVNAVSFGETRPACEGPRNTGLIEEVRTLVAGERKAVEACWAKNRRADIVTHHIVSH